MANRAVAAALRAGAAVEPRLPAAWWPRIDGFLASHLQREQRTREPLTSAQRAELIPHFAADVTMLEQLTGESFADWLDPERPGHDGELRPGGRIGTAHNSIDRPIGESTGSGVGPS